MYEGPFGGMLRRLKRVSVFSCVTTCVSIPLLSLYGNPDMSLVQRASVGVAALFFAVGTTATLTWVSKPYIWRMFQHHNKSLELHSFNMLGRLKVTTLENGLADIKPCSERAFVNLMTPKNDKFYVHEELDCYADEQFYDSVIKAAKIKVLN